MPPLAKRDCGLLIFDVNSQQKEKLLTALIKISTYKWFLATKDIYRLILSNTKRTENDKNYPNLHTTNFVDLDPRMVLESIENAEPEEGDWLDALLLGLHYLKEAANVRGILTLQLFFLTTLEKSKRLLDEKKVKKIIEELREFNVYLYIVGPDIKFPKTIMCENDISECMKQLKVDESNPSLAVAKRIIQSTKNGVMCDVKVGIHLFYCFKTYRGSQPWKVPLSFGSFLEIPAFTVKVYRKDNPFRLMAKKSRGLVRVLADDETVEVKDHDMIKGVVRHGKFVNTDVGDMFKVEGPRAFDVIGFTDKNSVAEIFMHGEEAYYVLPNDEPSENGCQAFYNLVEVLAEENKYAITRRVCNYNNKPKFFVLIPRLDLQPICFLMVALPFADEIADHKFEIPTPGKIIEDDKVGNFGKSIDITERDCEVYVPLSPTMMIDWHTNRMINAGAKKYLQRDFDFDAIDLDYFLDNNVVRCAEDLKLDWPPENEKN